MQYDLPIKDDNHAQWCLREAASRYQGKIITDEEFGMYLVQDSAGLTHTDAVLRALSFYHRTPRGTAGSREPARQPRP